MGGREDGFDLSVVGRERRGGTWRWGIDSCHSPGGWGHVSPGPWGQVTGIEGPTDLMPQIFDRVEARRAPAGARRPEFQRRRAAALVRGWTGTFFTGAEGGGGSLSMSGLSRDR